MNFKKITGILFLFSALLMFLGGCKTFNKAYIPGYRSTSNDRFEDVLIKITIPKDYTFHITIPARKEVKIKHKQFTGTFDIVLDVGKAYDVKLVSFDGKEYPGKLFIRSYNNINNEDYKLNIDNIESSTFSEIDKGKIFRGVYKMCGEELVELYIGNDKSWEKIEPKAEVKEPVKPTPPPATVKSQPTQPKQEIKEYEDDVVVELDAPPAEEKPKTQPANKKATKPPVNTKTQPKAKTPSKMTEPKNVDIKPPSTKQNPKADPKKSTDKKTK